MRACTIALNCRRDSRLECTLCTPSSFYLSVSFSRAHFLARLVSFAAASRIWRNNPNVNRYIVNTVSFEFIKLLNAFKTLMYYFTVVHWLISTRSCAVSNTAKKYCLAFYVICQRYKHWALKLLKTISLDSLKFWVHINNRISKNTSKWLKLCVFDSW